MRILMVAALMASVLPAGGCNAAEPKTIAVFTKNMTNPAYEAFRIAADQIARATDTRVVHFVPKRPDSVDEQKAMVQQVLKERPDAITSVTSATISETPIDKASRTPLPKDLPRSCR